MSWREDRIELLKEKKKARMEAEKVEKHKKEIEERIFRFLQRENLIVYENRHKEDVFWIFFPDNSKEAEKFFCVRYGVFVFFVNVAPFRSIIWWMDEYCLKQIS